MATCILGEMFQFDIILDQDMVHDYNDSRNGEAPVAAREREEELDGRERSDWKGSKLCLISTLLEQ